MAKDVANDLRYLVELDKKGAENLGSIRHWTNLQVGFEGASIWIKGFSFEQINASEVLSIPFVKRYREEGGKLFPYHSRLPARPAPNVLWTPMERGLAVTLPKLNFNYFGMEEQFMMQLLPSKEETTAIAMLLSKQQLEAYIQAAPKIRLKKIQWVILGDHQVFLLGRPLLPIPGAVFWQRGDFILPSGWDFELPLLVETFNEKINPGKKNWVLWNEEGQYFLIEKNKLQTLSIASFRSSFLNQTENK